MLRRVERPTAAAHRISFWHFTATVPGKRKKTGRDFVGSVNILNTKELHLPPPPPPGLSFSFDKKFRYSKSQATFP